MITAIFAASALLIAARACVLHPADETIFDLRFGCGGTISTQQLCSVQSLGRRLFLPPPFQPLGEIRSVEFNDVVRFAEIGANMSEICVRTLAPAVNSNTAREIIARTLALVKQDEDKGIPVPLSRSARELLYRLGHQTDQEPFYAPQVQELLSEVSRTLGMHASRPAADFISFQHQDGASIVFGLNDALFSPGVLGNIIPPLVQEDKPVALHAAAAACDSLLKRGGFKHRRTMLAKLLVDCGKAFAGVKRSHDAVTTVRTAIKVDPEGPLVMTARVILGWMLDSLFGEKGAAEEQYHAAMLINPEHCASPINLGWLYIDTGQFDRAASVLLAAYSQSMARRALPSNTLLNSDGTGSYLWSEELARQNSGNNGTDDEEAFLRSIAQRTEDEKEMRPYIGQKGKGWSFKIFRRPPAEGSAAMNAARLRRLKPTGAKKSDSNALPSGSSSAVAGADAQLNSKPSAGRRHHHRRPRGLVETPETMGESCVGTYGEKLWFNLGQAHIEQRTLSKVQAGRAWLRRGVCDDILAALVAENGSADDEDDESGFSVKGGGITQEEENRLCGALQLGVGEFLDALTEVHERVEARKSGKIIADVSSSLANAPGAAGWQARLNFSSDYKALLAATEANEEGATGALPAAAQANKTFVVHSGSYGWSLPPSMMIKHPSSDFEALRDKRRAAAYSWLSSKAPFAGWSLLQSLLATPQIIPADSRQLKLWRRWTLAGIEVLEKASSYYGDCMRIPDGDSGISDMPFAWHYHGFDDDRVMQEKYAALVACNYFGVSSLPYVQSGVEFERKKPAIKLLPALNILGGDASAGSENGATTKSFGPSTLRSSSRGIFPAWIEEAVMLPRAQQLESWLASQAGSLPSFPLEVREAFKAGYKPPQRPEGFPLPVMRTNFSMPFPFTSPLKVGVLSKYFTLNHPHSQLLAGMVRRLDRRFFQPYLIRIKNADRGYFVDPVMEDAVVCGGHRGIEGSQSQYVNPFASDSIQQRLEEVTRQDGKAEFRDLESELRWAGYNSCNLTREEKEARLRKLAVTLPLNVTEAAREIAALKLDVLLGADHMSEGLTYSLGFARLAAAHAQYWGNPVTTGKKSRVPTTPLLPDAARFADGGSPSAIADDKRDAYATIKATGVNGAVDYFVSGEHMEVTAYTTDGSGKDKDGNAASALPKGGASFYSERLVLLPGSGIHYETIPMPAPRFLCKCGSAFGVPEPPGCARVNNNVSALISGVRYTSANINPYSLAEPNMLVIDSLRPVPSSPSPSSQDGKERPVVFGCPQSLFKLRPEFDAVLARVLRAVPNSLLVMVTERRDIHTRQYRQRILRSMLNDECAAIVNKCEEVADKDPGDGSGRNGAGGLGDAYQGLAESGTNYGFGSSSSASSSSRATRLNPSERVMLPFSCPALPPSCADDVEGVVSRIRWVPRQSGSDAYFALMSCVDVLLHPFPFDGSKTAADGIAIALPIVTLPTNHLRGRMGYALYRTLGLQNDLVAQNESHYVDLAVKLGRNENGFRDEMIAKMRARRHWLFDQPHALTSSSANGKEDTALALPMKPDGGAVDTDKEEAAKRGFIIRGWESFFLQAVIEKVNEWRSLVGR